MSAVGTLPELVVHVPGIPVPQGSTRAFARNGRVHTTNDPSGRIERWRGDIRSAVTAEIRVTHGDASDWYMLADPISMRLSFRMPRPASHFLPANGKRSAPVLRLDAPHWTPSGADIDKLARAVLDALTGVVYADDSQVVSVVAAKRYATPGEGPGLRLELRRAPTP